MRKILENAGYETRSYSGRGMYGKQCLGVVTDDSLSELVINVLDLTDDENIKKQLKKTHQDNMGLSMIYYWPNVERSDE